MGSRGAKAADEAWTQDTELSLKERSTVENFLRGGSSVVGWTAFECIEDIDLVSRQAGGSQNFGQKLSRLANKRLPDSVLVGAWGLANQT
jgi:hypothetical protein